MPHVIALLVKLASPVIAQVVVQGLKELAERSDNTVDDAVVQTVHKTLEHHVKGE